MFVSDVYSDTLQLGHVMDGSLVRESRIPALNAHVISKERKDRRMSREGPRGP